MERLKAFEIAVELYCCLKGRGVGDGTGSGDIWTDLGVDVEGAETLLDKLQRLADEIFSRTN